MILTNKARKLAPRVHDLLEQLNTTLFHDDKFDPKTSTRQFVIGMTSYSRAISTAQT